MPAVPATLNFTPLTDPLIWFPNKDAFNAFMSRITVSLDGVNLPVATVTTYGGVKEATIATYVPAVVTPTYVQFATEDPAGVPVVTQIPSKQAYDDLKSKVDSLGILIVNLMNAQAAANQLVLT